MDNIKFRPYQKSDFDTISCLLEDFIDYLASLDPDKRIVKQADYGNNYLRKTLKEVNNKNGSFIIAEIENKIVGFGVAIVEKLSQNDLMEVLPHTPGRIIELYVDSKYRGKGIGTQLMQQLESYLKQKGCQTIHIEVYAPNVKTHKLYKRFGYSDRNIDMLKLL